MSSSPPLLPRCLKRTFGSAARHVWFSFMRTSSVSRTVRRAAAHSSTTARPSTSPSAAPFTALRSGWNALYGSVAACGWVSRFIDVLPMT